MYSKVGRLCDLWAIASCLQTTSINSARTARHGELSTAHELVSRSRGVVYVRVAYSALPSRKVVTLNLNTVEEKERGKRVFFLAVKCVVLGRPYS